MFGYELPVRRSLAEQVSFAKAGCIWPFYQWLRDPGCSTGRIRGFLINEGCRWPLVVFSLAFGRTPFYLSLPLWFLRYRGRLRIFFSFPFRPRVQFEFWGH